MSVIQENKTIFQICIDLNDDIEELKKSRKKLLELNSDWNYLYIKSQRHLDQIMIDNFKNSTNKFENCIYKLYYEIPNFLEGSKKVQEITDVDEKERVRLICALVSRTDVFRLGMVYRFGGLWCDLSSKFEMDINSDFANYDCCFIRKKEKEIRSSLIYAKKKHPVIKKILDLALHLGLNEKCGNQYKLAGPGCVTTAINSIPKHELIKYKTKIFDDDDLNSCGYWSMKGVWKERLHTPSKSNPCQKINEHWLFSEY